MMDIVLKIVELVNNDVISTSSSNTYLARYRHASDSDDLTISVYGNDGGYILGIDHDPTKVAEIIATFPGGTAFTNGSYFYHSDVEGNFIEWCPDAGSNHRDRDGAELAHGIEKN